MVDVSPGIIDLLGVTREDWLREGSDWSDYVHPDDRERVVAESDACVATSEPFHCEYRAVHADGRVVWVREDAVLIRDADEAAIYWLGIMLDVTELSTRSATSTICRTPTARSSSRSRPSSTRTRPTSRGPPSTSRRRSPACSA